MTAPYFTLLHEGGFATGATRYSDTFGHRSCINVSVSIAGMTISAILDTGAEWCIIDPELLELVDLEPVRQITYTTRFGDISGTLNRANIIVQAEYGEALALETTIFKADVEDGDVWRLPNFLGWSNCLDRIRFAIDPDPTHPTFYFGSL